MFDNLRLVRSSNFWKYCFSPKKAARSVLEVYGTLWLALEITDFFFKSVSTWVSGRSAYFFALGILYGLFKARPRNNIRARILGKDIVVEILIGDIFKFQGSIAVPANTTFDTDMYTQIISNKSIQGQFTQKYYGNVGHLDHDLNFALKDEAFETIPQNTNLKRKNKKFPIGTVAKLSAQGRTAYLFAMAHLNDHHVAHSSLDELNEALAKLWAFIRHKGECDTILIPVIGTVHARINESRETIIKESVASFIAASHDQMFCQKLQIVIYHKDFVENEINISELSEYLTYKCKYAETGRRNSVAQVGQAVPVQGTLTILSANYGTDSQNLDVQHFLIGKIANNALRVKVSNKTFGSDPTPGISKRLLVRFRFNNVEIQKLVNESEEMFLP